MDTPQTPQDVSQITDRGLVQVAVTSYGVLHGTPPSGDAITVDLSNALRNPHHDPQMKFRTGLDKQVRDHVLATPGARSYVERTVTRVRAQLAALPGELVELHVYCRGGRHRSVAIAEEVTAWLRAAGIATEVEHRDVDKPVVQK